MRRAHPSPTTKAVARETLCPLGTTNDVRSWFPGACSVRPIHCAPAQSSGVNSPVVKDAVRDHGDATPRLSHHRTRQEYAVLAVSGLPAYSICAHHKDSEHTMTNDPNPAPTATSCRLHLLCLVRRKP